MMPLGITLTVVGPTTDRTVTFPNDLRLVQLWTRYILLMEQQYHTTYLIIDGAD